jgi:hypothetical protein
MADCTSARNTPDFFQRIRQAMHRQAEACVAVQGQHFEHPNASNNCYCLSLE